MIKSERRQKGGLLMCLLVETVLKFAVVNDGNSILMRS